MTKEIHSPLRPMLIVFAVLSVFFITGKNWLLKNDIDPALVIIGNLVLFAVSMAAYFITQKSFRSSNQYAFIRAVNGSFIIKFMVIVFAAFIYFWMAGKEVNKPGLFVCAALYIVYTAVETRALMKLLKKKKENA
ncbi:MAG: hypothetical protein IPH18_17340 [Chitinophagaceae bacterium]|nr:hypothetical protein [Chitinophagaceae bacterium]MBK8953601.1 hypothetical protein [Chitinophagaceae bacterium]